MNIKRIGTLMAIIGLSVSSVAAAAGKEEGPTVNVAAAESLAVAGPISSTYVAPQVRRPLVLPALYATLGAMQVWDVYSTSAALKAGAQEANPLAAPFASNNGSMFALKAVTTASTIFFAERMWKKNRVGAVVLMVAINGATAAVAMQNMRNARLAR